MTIKISDIIANIFIELNDNEMPMIISLKQLYKVISIMVNRKYNIDFNEAAIFRLYLNEEKYFNFIKNTNEIVLVTNVNIKELKEKFRGHVSSKLYNIYKDPNILRILEIENIEAKQYKKK